MFFQLWEVVGGGAKGGIVARAGQELESPLLTDRVATGSLVRELKLEGERLNYELVIGGGPPEGWVSLKLTDGKDLLVKSDREFPRGQLWQVVGGVGKGGILVRLGEDLASAEASQRLATGTIIRELRQSGDRLHYEKLSGPGPGHGWVSLRTSGKDILAKLDGPLPPPKPNRYSTARNEESVFISVKTATYTKPQPPPLDGKKIKVLCIHGGGSNSTAMKFQSIQLKQLMKANAEFDFVDGSREWDDEEMGKHTPREEAELKLVGKQPFRSWFDHEFDPPRPIGWSQREMFTDPSTHCTLMHFDAAISKVESHIAKAGPFDVLMGFSQGGELITLLSAKTLRESGKIPWRLNVLFNSMWVRDPKLKTELLSEPLTHPCLQVYGRNDHFRIPQGDKVKANYVDPIVIEHNGFHNFPPPDMSQSSEVYAEVAASMRWHCGFK